jgi:hypothetical protein
LHFAGRHVILLTIKGNVYKKIAAVILRQFQNVSRLIWKIRKRRRFLKNRVPERQKGCKYKNEAGF